ncbi:DNA mismatch repair endonuclease MutL [candidate division WWE3 bacterium]|nr:DNA mismatch repair endonuclease MutL [candidate division WWE3 bacterium]
MGKIIKLPQSVIQKTAAGEVIENPASVVKELIENSLDAGAASIKIHVQKGGQQKILVVDNGCGMQKDDLLLSYKPHTSSKIQKEDDLNSIATFGFRGEALNSISTVSNFTIKSKEPNSPTGWALNIYYGKEKELKPSGLSTGTIVEVANLFSNLPARREFLKSAQAELTQIKQVVASMALANPSVAFLLQSDNKTILNIPSQYDLQKRIQVLLDDAGKFLDVTKKDPHHHIHGKISLPQFSTNTGKDQYLFVNGRYVNFRASTSAIKRAYGTLLDKYQYPKHVLYLQLPHELVDVNVHPRKEEVRFKNETHVLELLHQAIQQSLDKANLTYRYDPKPAQYVASLYSNLKDSVEMWSVSDLPEADSVTEVLQFLQTYLIVPLKDRVLFIDQHAAHEKILYAQILDFLKGASTEDLFEPKDPVQISTEDLDFEVDDSKLALLSDLGLNLTLEDAVLKIKQVPKVFSGLNLEDFVIYLLSLDEAALSLSYSSDVSNMISTLACKSAVKAGDFLTQEQALRLVKKLLNTDLEKYTCPHGRPTMVEFLEGDFERMFKRH